MIVKRYGGIKTRKRKFGNKRINTKDGWFDSKGELKRWEFLKFAQLAGEISGLERQVEFSIDIGTDHICSYFADYTYYRKDGTYVVEDFKGVITDVFKLKAKMIKIFHGIEVKIVKKANAPV